MTDTLLIIALSGIIAYWWDTMYTNELALNACQQLCQASNMQLLDGTVMRQRVWLRRSLFLRLQICRLYSFEYSDDNESRLYGYIVTTGHQVAETRMRSKQLH
jgi:hypothetical protein